MAAKILECRTFVDGETKQTIHLEKIVTENDNREFQIVFVDKVFKITRDNFPEIKRTDWGRIFIETILKHHTGRYSTSIRLTEVEITINKWIKKHYNLIKQSLTEQKGGILDEYKQ